MGWVVCSDAVLESRDTVLIIVVTASRCICDAVSSHCREILEPCWCRHVLEDTKFLVSGIATTTSTQHEWYSRFDKHIVVASDDGRDDVYKRYSQFHDHGYDLGGDILGIVVDFPNMVRI
ncbi:hypothetical protein Tco_0874093 [Tanacetum coccineum]|uniref:Uncharacterized protein n=1 Tax=Tanacetum coccineum TaxID=301880 RepID=A0ABQ5BNL0_9ASTR